MNPRQGVAIADVQVRDVHFDGCSLTRWAESRAWGDIARRMHSLGLHVSLLLDVLFEVFRKFDSAHRYQHMRPLRLLGSQVRGVPLAAELLTTAAAGRDPSRAFEVADQIVKKAIRRAELDTEAVLYERDAGRRGKLRLIETGRMGRALYVAQGATRDASFQEAVVFEAKDRANRRAYHSDLLRMSGNATTSRRMYRLWWANPMIRCWALGWIWHSREASLETRNRRREKLPNHADLDQLVALPHCDAFVTDDARLGRAAREVCSIGRGRRREDPWSRPAPWVGTFEEFTQAIMADR